MRNEDSDGYRGSRIAGWKNSEVDEVCRVPVGDGCALAGYSRAKTTADAVAQEADCEQAQRLLWTTGAEDEDAR
jgi:hypothetical protein